MKARSGARHSSCPVKRFFSSGTISGFNRCMCCQVVPYLTAMLPNFCHPVSNEPRDSRFLIMHARRSCSFLLGPVKRIALLDDVGAADRKAGARGQVVRMRQGVVVHHENGHPVHAEHVCNAAQAV